VRLVFLGRSITSSWGNGHATTYRGLVRALVAAGHEVLFLERDVPGAAANRDLPRLPWGRSALYGSLEELRECHGDAVASADLVVVGSCVPDGIRVGDWVLSQACGAKAFYDLDTPVTLGALGRGNCASLSPLQVGRYDLYLSCTAGPTLARLERKLGARRARPLYRAFDPEAYFPENSEPAWDLGYLGTYSACRQPALERLMLEPARREPGLRMVVAGARYPEGIAWPGNVARIEHLSAAAHRRFYCSQRFTLNATRAERFTAGWTPSVRLFEAAACGTPVISEPWPGLEDCFQPGSEVLVSGRPEDTLQFLRAFGPEERMRLAERARARALAQHTAGHRAEALLGYVREVESGRRARAHP
jgi:spore maturation protein CgeB